jgi:protein-L-isoaspartate O-methyltransferase
MRYRLHEFLIKIAAYNGDRLRMAGELAFKDEAAAESDRLRILTAHFMPILLRAAHLALGMRVLDIATGTGLSSEAALAAVGPTGHVTAADLSPAMVEKARARLGKALNVSVSVEDGQALSFPDRSFDAVLCNLGLMFFPSIRWWSAVSSQMWNGGL